MDVGSPKEKLLLNRSNSPSRCANLRNMTHSCSTVISLKARYV